MPINTPSADILVFVQTNVPDCNDSHVKADESELNDCRFRMPRWIMDTRRIGSPVPDSLKWLNGLEISSHITGDIGCHDSMIQIRDPANEGNLPEKSSRPSCEMISTYFLAGSPGCQSAAGQPRGMSNSSWKRDGGLAHVPCWVAGLPAQPQNRELQSLLADVMAAVSSTTNFSISSPSNIHHLESRFPSSDELAAPISTAKQTPSRPDKTKSLRLWLKNPSGPDQLVTGQSRSKSTISKLAKIMT